MSVSFFLRVARVKVVNFSRYAPHDYTVAQIHHILGYRWYGSKTPNALSHMHTTHCSFRTQPPRTRFTSIASHSLHLNHASPQSPYNRLTHRLRYASPPSPHNAGRVPDTHIASRASHVQLQCIASSCNYSARHLTLHSRTCEKQASRYGPCASAPLLS